MYHVPRSSKTESLIETPLQIYSSTLVILYLEMHDEIFHFEMFKNFMKILKYLKTLF